MGSSGAFPGLAGDLDRIPWGGERRRVAEIEVRDLRDPHAVVDRGGERVDPLGHLTCDVPEDLRAEQPSVVAVADDP